MLSMVLLALAMTVSACFLVSAHCSLGARLTAVSEASTSESNTLRSLNRLLCASVAPPSVPAISLLRPATTCDNRPCTSFSCPLIVRTSSIAVFWGAATAVDWAFISALIPAASARTRRAFLIMFGLLLV